MIISDKKADTLVDFVSGVDKIVLAKSTFTIGDGDSKIENAASRAAGGGFSAAAEMVTIATSVANNLNDVAAATGSAAAAYKVGDTRLFQTQNSGDGYLYFFKSADSDAAVKASGR